MQAHWHVKEQSVNYYWNYELTLRILFESTNVFFRLCCIEQSNNSGGGGGGGEQ